MGFRIFNVNITDEEFKTFKTFCRQKEIPMAKVIRDFIKSFITQSENEKN